MPSKPPNPCSATTFVGDGEMAALMRSHDWATTPLGSVENWSPSLRTLVSTMLPSHFAQIIFWGEDYIQLYNDAVIPIYGAKHPRALGQAARETWAEIWHDQMQPVLKWVKTTGEAFFAADQPFYPTRFGYLEETYFTFCYSPIRDGMDKVSGMLCTATETTQQVIGQRRLTMLRELAMAISGAKTRSSVYLTATAVLNPYDIPFAVFYQVNGNLAERVACSGLSADSAVASREINLTERSASWSLMEVFQSREPMLMTDVVDRFGAFPVEPWGESPRSAFILPILSSNQAAVEGLLVAGISPRLEFNADYRAFLGLVAQQVESAIAIARSYEEERQRAEALAELDRAKTTFFSNVSHGFRTPLTLMLAPLEDVLATLAERADLKEPLQVVHRNGLRLLKLVNMLLDFSRMESDRISASYQPTDLAAFTAELASVFRSAIEKANLRLVVDCPPLPEPVYVDRAMWEKIVLNLLSNAFKFTFTGEIRVSLRWGDGGDGGDKGGKGDGGDREVMLISSSPSSSSSPLVILEVHDTGVGIPASEIPRLFERFYQVKGAQGRTIEGSGIGLSLVQELVKLQGGTVQVSSMAGQGTCFTVAIPTGSAHLPPDRVGASPGVPSPSIGASPYVEEALWWLPEMDEMITPSANQEERSQVFSPSYSHTASSSANRVLLVDDNADMRDYVKRLLS